jgi:peptide/nickel transport system substrate-binding protein
MKTLTDLYQLRSNGRLSQQSLQCWWLRVCILLAMIALVGCGQSTTQERTTFVFPTPTPTPFGYFAGTPQPGGVWTRALSANPVNFNPLLAADHASSAVHAMLYPSLVRQDPVTGQYGSVGAMAERWDLSSDGRTWTFYLRPGVAWSDGEAVDAYDFKYTYDAIRFGNIDSPHQRLAAPIESIEIVNPLTVRVAFNEERCDALSLLRVGWLPGHRFAEDFSDVGSAFFNQSPDVSAGPFIFQSYIPNDSVVLRRNSRYWQGAPLMERMVFRIVPNAEERLSLLLSGALDETPLTPDQLIPLLDAPQIKVASGAIDAYDFIAINLASPASPQRGLSDEGVLLFQDPHPLLSERAVRESMAHAIDYRGIVSAIYLDQAYPLAANVLPIVPWAFDASLEQRTYSPDLARSILENSGWIDINRDGIREKDIHALRMSLIVPESNPYYTRIAEIVRDQLNSVGFDIRMQSLAPSVFTRQLLSQRFDLALSGWTDFGVDPDDHELWQAATDRPGSGFNFVSYQNQRIENLLEQGLTMRGCQPQDRAPIYREIQQILYNDLPYIFLAGIVQNIGYTSQWGGIAPGPWDFHHNVQTWYRLP